MTKKKYNRGRREWCEGVMVGKGDKGWGNKLRRSVGRKVRKQRYGGRERKSVEGRKEKNG